MTAPLDPQIAPLDAARIPQTAALLAAALHDDPAYQFLLPGDDPSGSRALADFFARNFAVHLPFACTHLLLGAADELLGTMPLRPPGGVHVSLPTMLRHGRIRRTNALPLPTSAPQPSTAPTSQAPAAFA